MEQTGTRADAVRIDRLVKAYGDLRAVDSLSLVVHPGEILGLVGPNGAGKTSTLRCLAGIIPATGGSISICGFDLDQQPVEARAALAFVPDEPRLFEHLTVWDHLKVLSRIYQVEDGAERATRLLEELDLDRRRSSFPSELSRGMKQKLVLAAALLHRPRALILDEPLTGLDPSAMRRTKDIVLRTAAEGAGVIVSSHMLHLVEELCHRVVLIQNGRKILDGTLEEIRHSLPDLEEGADLEDIFLRATEGNGGS